MCELEGEDGLERGEERDRDSVVEKSHPHPSSRDHPAEAQPARVLRGRAIRGERGLADGVHEKGGAGDEEGLRGEQPEVPSYLEDS